MQRRHFIAGAAAMPLAPAVHPRPKLPTASAPFKLGYGPSPGQFAALAGDDYIDQIAFAHDQGFTAWEDNTLARREPELQEQVSF